MKQRDYDTGLLRIWVFESKLYLTALIANSPGKSHMLLKSLFLGTDLPMKSVFFVLVPTDVLCILFVLSLFLFQSYQPIKK